eukprot:5568328-Pleurochrysis_carterae.AAC.2
MIRRRPRPSRLASRERQNVSPRWALLPELSLSHTAASDVSSSGGTELAWMLLLLWLWPPGVPADDIENLASAAPRMTIKKRWSASMKMGA